MISFSPDTNFKINNRIVWKNIRFYNKRKDYYMYYKYVDWVEKNVVEKTLKFNSHTEYLNYKNKISSLV
jgi:hypothetical protein